MPTIARIGPYRIFFFSNEAGEAPHVHIRREDALAKFWLQPVELASATRFRAHELAKLEKMVAEHQKRWTEAWHEYFGR